MAIFHLCQRNINTGKGQSAVARVKYILRLGSAASRGDLLESGSSALPEWAADDPPRFFRTADIYEARGQAAKSVDVALPVELSSEARQALLENFISGSLRDTAGNPFPCVWAIHKNTTNPHAHIVYSRRGNDGIKRANPELYFKRADKKNPERGGAAKDKVTVTRDWLRNFRKQWENICNRALTAADSSERIDCRTLKAQGIDREPTGHLGPAESRGIKTKRGERNRKKKELADLRAEVEREVHEEERLEREKAGRIAREQEEIQRRRAKADYEKYTTRLESINESDKMEYFAMLDKEGLCGANMVDLEFGKASFEWSKKALSLFGKEDGIAIIEKCFSEAKRNVEDIKRAYGERTMKATEDLETKRLEEVAETAAVTPKEEVAQGMTDVRAEFAVWKAKAAKEGTGISKFVWTTLTDEELLGPAKTEIQHNHVQIKEKAPQIPDYRSELAALAEKACPRDQVKDSVRAAWQKPFLERIAADNEDSGTVADCLRFARHDASTEGQAELKSIKMRLDEAMRPIETILLRRMELVRAMMDRIRVEPGRQKALESLLIDLTMQIRQSGRGR